MSRLSCFIQTNTILVKTCTFTGNILPFLSLSWTIAVYILKISPPFVTHFYGDL
jgi:hypothetical protein